MGQFLFDVPDEASDFVARSLWKQAYICGIEGVPWQSHSQFDGSRLTITRSIDSSGKLYLACPIDGLGYRLDQYYFEYEIDQASIPEAAKVINLWLQEPSLLQKGKLDELWDCEVVLFV